MSAPDGAAAIVSPAGRGAVTGTLNDTAAIASRPLLQACGVSKRWRSTKRMVLDDVTVSFEPSSATLIAGRNGVGKTTLLRILTGLIKPDAGRVSLEGLHPERDRAAYQRGLAFLPAGDRGLYARLSARRHLGLWARLSFMPRGERDEAIEAAIERFGLSEFATRRVDRLSTGQRQRVRLAGLTLHRPKLLLLDEPNNSLDEEGIALLEGMVSGLLERGGSVVWCSPDAKSSGFEFDRTLALVEGKLEGR